uniref:Uncharacterized protein n=1 Tax=Oryza punctata TaxID=4537 RepID=A0A0E0LC85_ORYPU
MSGPDPGQISNDLTCYLGPSLIKQAKLTSLVTSGALGNALSDSESSSPSTPTSPAPRSPPTNTIVPSPSATAEPPSLEARPSTSASEIEKVATETFTLTGVEAMLSTFR